MKDYQKINMSELKQKSPKIVLFDIDGVFINVPHYFSKNLIEMGYANAKEELDKFFSSKEYSECLLGKRDQLGLADPYLENFGWQKGALEYFNSQFEFEAQFLDREMLELAKSLKDDGVKCILCTEQDRMRFQFIFENLKFKGIFERGFVSSDIGFLKREDGFWEHAIKNLKESYGSISLEEIAFFDDKQINVDTSLKFGLNSFLFTDIDKFKKDLNF